MRWFPGKEKMWAPEGSKPPAGQFSTFFWRTSRPPPSGQIPAGDRVISMPETTTA
jgi:hypothetical protein